MWFRNKAPIFISKQFYPYGEIITNTTTKCQFIAENIVQQIVFALILSISVLSNSKKKNRKQEWKEKSKHNYKQRLLNSRSLDKQSDFHSHNNILVVEQKLERNSAIQQYDICVNSIVRPRLQNGFKIKRVGISVDCMRIKYITMNTIHTQRI